MINSINNFLAAKVKNEKTIVTGLEYNYLIDLLNKSIKILSASIDSGLTVTSTGVLNLGNELVALQALSDATGFIRKNGHGSYSIDTTEYEPHTNELTALSELADTAGFVKKTGDGTYAIDTTEYMEVGTVSSSIWGYM